MRPIIDNNTIIVRGAHDSKRYAKRLQLRGCLDFDPFLFSIFIIERWEVDVYW